MKSVLFASAAAVAVLAAAPAFAETAPTGYVGVDYARTNIDTPFGDVDADTWGLNGAVAFDAAEGLGVQLNGAYGNTDIDAIGSTDAWTGAAHLFTRNDSYAFGGFAGLTNSDDSTTWTVGVEGQKYLDNVTLAGAFGYGNNDDADVSFWSLGGEARYFVNDNFRLQGGLGWSRVDAFGADDQNLWTVGLGGEYQFAKAPVSLYASYGYTKADDFDVKANTFMVGVRYNFGGTTLKSRDRSGASFGGVPGLGGVASLF